MADGRVAEFVRNQVGEDWDDDVVTTARFKAFSGPRSDWEPKYRFWKDLIFKVARYLNVFIISPLEVKRSWFDRGGLSPLCLDQVLVEMYKDGEIMRMNEFVDPTCSQLSVLFRKALRIFSRPTLHESVLEDSLVILPLLKEKSSDVVKTLSQNHWTPSCTVTKEKFQALCGGPNEAFAILSYLSESGKAKYVLIKKRDVIEGVKISLSQDPVPNLTSLDYDVLHMIWTTERLQKQLDVLDQRYANSRSSAMTSLSSGNRTTSLRHVREMKLASQNREKCAALLSRVEEVLDIIANAESTKKVTEAIQIGARAMKENKISVTEVENCLQELDEAVDLQKHVARVLESSPPHDDIDDEDMEEELVKLEFEILNEEAGPSTADYEKHDTETENDLSASLCQDLLKLNISNTSTESSKMPQLRDKGSHYLEAA